MVLTGRFMRVWRRARLSTTLALGSLSVGLAMIAVTASAWFDNQIAPTPLANADKTVQVMTVWTYMPDVPLSQAAFGSVAAIRGSVQPTYQVATEFDDDAVVDAGAEHRRAVVSVVSSNYFAVVGVRARFGRTPVSSDSATHARVAVLSDGLWKRAFGEDQGAVGAVIRVADVPYAVIGIAPPVVDRVVGEPELWISAGASAIPPKSLGDILIGGAGPSEVAGVRVAVGRAFEVLRHEQPDLVRDMHGMTIAPLRDLLRQKNGGAQLGYATVVAVSVLLIGGLNFAILLLLDAVTRSRDVSIRMALGSPASWILRQLLLEVQALGVVALVAAAAIAVWLVRELGGLQQSRLFPSWSDPAVVPLVASVVAIGWIVFALACTVPAALVVRGVNVQAALKQGEAGSSPGARTLRMVRALVVGEVVLLVAFVPLALFSGLTLLRESRLRVGFNYADVLEVRVAARRTASTGVVPLEPQSSYENAARRVPGIQDATLGRISGVSHPDAIWTPDANGRPKSSLHLRMTSVGFSARSLVRTLQIPLITGRLPTQEEEDRQAPVALLGESAARRLFPGQNPLGQLVVIDSLDVARHTLSVVGVVADVRTHLNFRPEEQPTVFVLFLPPLDGPVHLYLRAPKATASRLADIRQALNREMPWGEVQSISMAEATLARSLTFYRTAFVQYACITSVFLLLTVVGIFGSTAYGVRIRLKEIGIRRALGASSPHIVATLASSAAIDAIAALVMGLPLGIVLLADRSRAGFEAMSTEPALLALCALVVLLVVVAGTAVPLARGLRVAPARILREE